MSEERITAFPDGNSFVGYSTVIDKLLIGNSDGLIKIFNTNEPDLEPTSIDISENLTSLSSYSNQALVTNTGGNMELIDLGSQQSKGFIYRSELPLRDATFINEGKRVLGGGDDNKLVVVDLENDRSVSTITIPDQLLDISYNPAGEILALSLSDGSVQLYSVINEKPHSVDSISNILSRKIHTSMDRIDFNSEHKEELVATKTEWTSNGEMILIPTFSNTIKVFERSDLKNNVKELGADESEDQIIDFSLSSDNKFVAVLYFDSSVKVFNFQKSELHDEVQLSTKGNHPINIIWNNSDIYVGTTTGNIIILKNIVNTKGKKGLNNLFVDEAEESDGEENNTDNLLNDSEAEEEANAESLDNFNSNGTLKHYEDSMVIDEEDDEDDYYGGRMNGYAEGHQANKRHKPHLNGYTPSRSVTFSGYKNSDLSIEPYSPGSSPWINNNHANTKSGRRYLSMNSIGYVWAVKNNSAEESLDQQSISVSFFDRSVGRDYHFTDSSLFDLCSINKKGLLLGASGENDPKKLNNGRLYYRGHESTQDSWEKVIPLLKNEIITSISITDDFKDNLDEDVKIIVGTNYGYVRIFNMFGVCINIFKTTPVVTLICSHSGLLFMIHQVTVNVYTFSLVDVNDDYKYIQHNALLPLKTPTEPEIPLIKGIFFSEYSDPCLVSGIDDTLLVLQSWREANNYKWVPLLNCKNSVTEFGSNENKKDWKCWPLGLYKEQLTCLILKGSSQYPGFPLPLPVELDIRLPISITSGAIETASSSDDGESDIKKEKADPEETFLRSLTMGKIVSDTMNDEGYEEDNEDIMERLQDYSVAFDKSLLQIFGVACREYKLKKAYSVAKMMRTDKALSAASKICERMDLISLATNINKIRERMVNVSDDED